MSDFDSFDALFSPEPAARPASAREPWKILLVDDEPDIHAVLRLALNGVEVDGRPLLLLEAGSGQAARQLLAEHPDAALILLDVVMETELAGLDLVSHIRRELNYRNVQIIILTGQPGYAPQHRVVTDYEINGYRLKSELTADKIFVSVYSAVRTHRTLLERDEALARQKQAEADKEQIAEQLRQARLMESLGMLASGVAHDFNNLLQVITGNTNIAMMRLGPDTPAATNLNNIEQASAKAADLCSQLLLLAGKTRSSRCTLRIELIVDQAVRSLRKTVKPQITVHYEYPKELPAVHADAVLLQQLVENLGTNAAEAINGNPGNIDITLQRAVMEQQPPAKDFLGQKIPAGVYVVLSVSDTGGGMDDDVIGRIFDPFFSTKFIGRGLGLPAVRGIVAAHNGFLQFDSTPGTGTSFRVLLPAVP